MSIIFCLMMVYSTWGWLEINPGKPAAVQLHIFQWSTVSQFPNSSLHIYSKIPQNNTYSDLACLILPNGLKKASVDTIISNLKNSYSNQTLNCVLVQIPDQAIFYYTDTIDTPFVVGLLVNSPINLGGNATIEGKFLGWDINYGGIHKPISLSFYGINIFFDSLCIIWGIYMLYRRYLTNNFGLNISTVCITFEIFSVVWRIIGHYISVLVIGITDINLPYLDRIACYSLSISCDLAAGIFLIFFWIDITSSSLYHGAFLDKAFWPSLVLVSMGFVIVTPTSLMMFAGIKPTIVSNLVLTINTIGQVLGFIISIIYFFAAYRVKQYMKKKKDVKMVMAFKRMSIKIIVSGSTLIIVFCLMIGFISNWNATSFTPYGIYLKFAYDSFYTIRSYLMIEIFGSPPREKAKIKTNSSSKSGTETSKTGDDNNSQLTA